MARNDGARPTQLREGAKSTAWIHWSDVGFGILTPAAFASFASQDSSPRSANSGAQGTARTRESGHWATYEVGYNNSRSRFLSAASFGVRAPPFNHE